MNRVLRDMPEEPMVYLLRTIYKKAGIEIPQVKCFPELFQTIPFQALLSFG